MKLYRAVSLAALVLSACTTEKIQYVNRPPFTAGKDTTNGFLGYFTISTQQTSCGNCHVSTQAAWVTTKHASAWKNLKASGAASAFCYGCHTVSQLGNVVGLAGKPAGYNAVADSAYQDVQCESCHGPGFTHATSPQISNAPLASIHVDTALANGCGGCHTGIHEPFVDQWVQSAHASGPGFSHAVGSASCEPCHEGKRALAVKFGVTTNYLEKSDTSHQRITCVVCHDPHGRAGFVGQLRADITTPTTDNLCIKCHSRSGTPPWGVAPTVGSTARGAHGAQGLLVLGQNVGWIPPNFAYDTSQIVSSHGTALNTRLCATCHVAFTTVTDAKGVLVQNNVGHLFEAIPCQSAATGIPVPCATAAPADTVRSFVACATSGCHSTVGVAKTAYTSFKARVNSELDAIWLDLNGNGTIDSACTPGGTMLGCDTGLLPQLVTRAVRPGATRADSLPLRFDTTVTTVAKGTLFNAALAATSDRPYFLGGKVFGRGFATHMASGNGVHNPFLLDALLTASIAAVKTTYGLAPPPPAFSLQVQATRPPGVRLRASPQ
jgi:predicted CXXCH cytochrome family protein